MLGGGFIGQAHQTNKQNREQLKRNLKTPFDKDGSFDWDKHDKIDPRDEISPELRQKIYHEVQRKRNVRM